MKRPRAESTRIGKVLKQLVVNEAECPIRRQGSIHIFEIRAPGHIETNFEFRRAVLVSYNRCREDFNLGDENFPRLKYAEIEDNMMLLT